MSETYLVTGCAGFIASNVSRLLLERGDRVVGVDNINNAYDPALKEHRLAELQRFDGFTFHRIDVSDADAVWQLFDGGENFSAVVNLAARGGVRASVSDPHSFLQANVIGTLNLLEACGRLKIPKFVLASSSSVYGAGETAPYVESANTDQPLSPYAASKKAAEVLAYSYHSLYGIDVSALRYFTVYGPAGRPDMSVFRFVRGIAEGDTITIFGDGSQRRDFTYVEDIARGTIASLRPVGYEPINLGAGTPVVLMELVEEIEKATGKKAKIEYQPANSADVPLTWADTTKAKQLLDWEPRTTLRDGIRQAVAWYQQNREVAFAAC